MSGGDLPAGWAGRGQGGWLSLERVRSRDRQGGVIVKDLLGRPDFSFAMSSFSLGFLPSRTGVQSPAGFLAFQ